MAVLTDMSGMKTVAAMRNAVMGVLILAGAGLSAGLPNGIPANAPSGRGGSGRGCGERNLHRRPAGAAGEGRPGCAGTAVQGQPRPCRTDAQGGAERRCQRLSPSGEIRRAGASARPPGSADLKRMTPAQIVEFGGLQNNWLVPDAITQAGMERVSVRGDRASGTLVVNQRPVMVPADFVREGGDWRGDLTRAMDLTDAIVRGTALTATKRSEDAVGKGNPRPRHPESSAALNDAGQPPADSRPTSVPAPRGEEFEQHRVAHPPVEHDRRLARPRPRGRRSRAWGSSRR